jgi:UDP-N-acetylglucosamine transferase subunit ALG13
MEKRTIVVANDSLMDNHQMELADAMKAAGLSSH